MTITVMGFNGGHVFCGRTRRIFYNSRTTEPHHTCTVYLRKFLLGLNFRFLQQIIGDNYFKNWFAIWHGVNFRIFLMLCAIYEAINQHILRPINNSCCSFVRFCFSFLWLDMLCNFYRAVRNVWEYVHVLRSFSNGLWKLFAFSLFLCRLY